VSPDVVRLEAMLRMTLHAEWLSRLQQQDDYLRTQWNGILHEASLIPRPSGRRGSAGYSALFTSHEQSLNFLQEQWVAAVRHAQDAASSLRVNWDARLGAVGNDQADLDEAADWMVFEDAGLLRMIRSAESAGHLLGRDLLSFRSTVRRHRRLAGR
jgi:hypothetical protein